MTSNQLGDFLLQSLEHEMGGAKIYELALKCVKNSDLKNEWEEYLEQTKNHVKVLKQVCDRLDLNVEQDNPGRQIVRHIGEALVKAMEMALRSGDPNAAQRVACECVVLAETKDHMDWALIGECAEHLEGDHKKSLQEAVEELEDQEDEHLYHSKGWCRELWIEALGMAAVLPPPEERRQVKTAVGAAKAEQTRLLALKPDAQKESNAKRPDHRIQ
jgi:ferritin-like metal-binding protein YciE